VERNDVTTITTKPPSSKSRRNLIFTASTRREKRRGLATVGSEVIKAADSQRNTGRPNRDSPKEPTKQKSARGKFSGAYGTTGKRGREPSSAKTGKPAQRLGSSDERGNLGKEPRAGAQFYLFPKNPYLGGTDQGDTDKKTGGMWG